MRLKPTEHWNSTVSPTDERRVGNVLVGTPFKTRGMGPQVEMAVVVGGRVVVALVPTG